jgi:hypothetical protein
MSFRIPSIPPPSGTVLTLALLASVASNAVFAFIAHRAQTERDRWAAVAIEEDTELVRYDQSLRTTIDMLQQCSDLYVSGK